MKILGQGSIVLFCLVSFAHTAWRRKVCEGEYSAYSCLGSYPCMEEFLRCDCIPLQFAGQKFEDLCWTSLAYDVGAPICCINKGNTRLKSDAGTNIGNLLVSALRSTVQKRNDIEHFNAIINNDRKSKRTKEFINNRSKHKEFMPVPRMLTAYQKSVPKSIILRTDRSNWNFPQGKLMTDFIGANQELDETETDNEYHESHSTSVDDVYIGTKIAESAGIDQSLLQKKSFTRADNPFLHTVSTTGVGDILLSSLQNPRGMYSQYSHQRPQQKSHDTDFDHLYINDVPYVKSIPKLSDINKQNLQLMQNKILNAIKSI